MGATSTGHAAIRANLGVALDKAYLVWF